MKYHINSRILHWLMAALIIFLLSLGIYMANFLDKEAVSRTEIYSLHKSLGVMALILFFIRIVNRFVNKAPTLPDSLPKFEKIAANITHLTLYLLMLIIPLSGYLMSNYFGYPVNFFGVQMPFLVEKNFEIAKIFHETHEISAYLMIAVLSLHVLGAIKHRFFDKPENDVLKRMI